MDQAKDYKSFEYMDDLLNEPGINELVEQMTPETLEWFKESLVREGLYAQYVFERSTRG